DGGRSSKGRPPAPRAAGGSGGVAGPVSNWPSPCKLENPPSPSHNPLFPRYVEAGHGQSKRYSRSPPPTLREMRALEDAQGFSLGGRQSSGLSQNSGTGKLERSGSRSREGSETEEEGRAR
ncbi:unnamed protein product, partial [Choristocarpus tenellus]